MCAGGQREVSELLSAARRVIKGFETQNFDEFLYSKPQKRSVSFSQEQEIGDDMSEEFWRRIVKELLSSVERSSATSTPCIKHSLAISRMVCASRRVIKGIETGDLSGLKYTNATPRSSVIVDPNAEESMAKEFWCRLRDELKSAVTLTLNGAT